MNTDQMIDALYKDSIVHEQMPVEYQEGMEIFLQRLKENLAALPRPAEGEKRPIDWKFIADSLWNKWKVQYDERVSMPKDCFTLALQDVPEMLSSLVPPLPAEGEPKTVDSKTEIGKHILNFGKWYQKQLPSSLKSLDEGAILGMYFFENPIAAPLPVTEGEGRGEVKTCGLCEGSGQYQYCDCPMCGATGKVELKPNFSFKGLYEEYKKLIDFQDLSAASFRDYLIKQIGESFTPEPTPTQPQPLNDAPPSFNTNK